MSKYAELLVSTDREYISLLMKSLVGLDELQVAWEVKTKHNLQGPDEGTTTMFREEPMRIANTWEKDVVLDPSHLSLYLTAFLESGASGEYLDTTF
ncbi:hypothetical protein [Terracidiphilus sp.]|jgi:hypothetical protein|uniref:hypothetical protein n=1 Tax=Terracidiphilus sp. TaxID=1964191 RepID=UPI003C22F566